MENPAFFHFSFRFYINTQYDLELKDRSWITLGAIRSTGLTASRALAEYVREKLFPDEGTYDFVAPFTSCKKFVHQNPHLVSSCRRKRMQTYAQT